MGDLSVEYFLFFLVKYAFLIEGVRHVTKNIVKLSLLCIFAVCFMVNIHFTLLNSLLAWIQEEDI